MLKLQLTDFDSLHLVETKADYYDSLILSVHYDGYTRLDSEHPSLGYMCRVFHSSKEKFLDRAKAERLIKLHFSGVIDISLFFQ